MSARAAAATIATSPDTRLIARLRALVALLWAAAIGIAARDADTDLAAGLALIVAAYPVIDVVASLAEAARGGEARGRLRVNAVIGSLAVAALAGAGLASDVSAVLAVFGAWAVVSGLLQLPNAVQRRRGGARETPMLISGGLSAIAGLAIIASAGREDPSLGLLSGYAAVGAVLFLIWAHRSRPSS